MILLTLGAHNMAQLITPTPTRTPALTDESGTAMKPAGEAKGHSFPHLTVVRRHNR
ncbi:MAG: hypothetical protein QM645_09940 [Asticcacaulis sp.]